MNKIIYLPTILGLSLLSGCGDSRLDLVKNTKIDNSKYTYGEIYDNRKMCNSIKWAEEKKNDDETTVISTCSFELSKDQLQKTHHLAIAQENEYYDTFSRSYDRVTETIQNKIDAIEKTPNVMNFDAWMTNSASIEEAKARLKSAIDRKEKFGRNSSNEMEAAEHEIELSTRKLEESTKSEENNFKSLRDELNELKEKLDNHKHTIKSELHSELDQLKSTDINQIEEVLGKDLVATQSVYFKVLDDRVELTSMDLIFSGRKAPLNYDDISYLATEQAAPNNTSFLNMWEAWTTKKAGTLVTYNIKKPKYSCGMDRLGIECKKTEQ